MMVRFHSFSYVSVPRVPPRNVTITSLDATSVQVCWKKIPHFPTLEEYELHYNSIGQGNASVIVTVANVTFAILTGLHSSLSYAVNVAGKTADGLGPLSSPVNVQPKNYTSKWIFLCGNTPAGLNYTFLPIQRPS